MIIEMHLGHGPGEDLVAHTIKHFISATEREAWDQVPAGTSTASDQFRRLTGPTGPGLSVGSPLDERWWRPPALRFACEAHDTGYAPKYRALVEMLGGAGTGRWQRCWGGRSIGALHGFEVVVAPRQSDVIVISAYFASCFRAGDSPGAALRAFKAYADLKNCPPSVVPGVPSKVSAQ